MPTVYGPIDLLKNELRNATVQNLGAPPATPVPGLIYYDTTTNTLMWWDGAQWIAAKAAAGATPAATVTTLAVGEIPVVGLSTNFAREDHAHGFAAFGAVAPELTFGIVAADGVAVTLARSDHIHGTPPHVAADHTTIPLSTFAPAIATADMGGFRLLGVATPTAGTDAANKDYVDTITSGLSWKDPCRVATTADVPLTGLTAIDGITPVAGDRILVKNQTAAPANGIYVAAAAAWTRATDADDGPELEAFAVFVLEGTTQADTAWVNTADAPITPDTTPLAIVQFGGGGATYAAGAGLTLAGNTFDVGAGTGIVVAADTVAVDTTVIADRAYVDTAVTGMLTTAGQGLTSAGATIDIVGGVGITVGADLVSVDTTVIADRAYVDAALLTVPKKYAALLVGTTSPETVTHNLNTQDVTVQVISGTTPFPAVEVDWEATSVNSITVRFTPPLGAGYRVVVIG